MSAPAASRPLAGLYLHIPYCSAVCPYCDFAVQVGRAPERARFVDALCEEVGRWSTWSLPIDTVYLGGGTPSILGPEELARILARVHASLPIVEGARIAMEANPEDVHARSLSSWRELGVRTLSLGVQSFDDDELRWLGRRHRSADAIDAVQGATGAGFDTVSIDLIFGLPGQSQATWERSLRTAVELAPEHLSCYQLTVHEGTNYARRRDRGALTELDETSQAEHFALAHRVLTAAGWHAYEVSNFARHPRHRSVHNRKYWQHVPYLGLGPSAHSFDGERRWWNLREVDAYGDALGRGEPPLAGEERLGLDALALESVMLSLRTVEGIDLGAFERRYGIDLLARNRGFVEAAVTDGLLLHDGEYLRPTTAGLAVADGLAAALRLD